jgi:type II secretory pathway pseudopilin PulG
MKRQQSQGGFGIVETLMSMLIVGIILGIVARGYQALSRLNLASYQMSQRMELSAFLQRLSFEVASAIKITTSANGFSFQRIDPTLNLSYNEPATGRLPWPLPPGVTSVNVMLPAYQVAVGYQFIPANNTIERTAFSRTTTEAVSVGEFLPTLESGGRILAISMKPKEMTSAVKARILLPVVRP